MGAELLCLFITIILLGAFCLGSYDFNIKEREDDI